MISPLLGPSRKPLNALRGLRRKMAHFIPSAGVHWKGSSNSTTTAFCAPLKKKRRWAPGSLVVCARSQRHLRCASPSVEPEHAPSSKTTSAAPSSSSRNLARHRLLGSPVGPPERSTRRLVKKGGQK